MNSHLSSKTKYQKWSAQTPIKNYHVSQIEFD